MLDERQKAAVRSAVRELGAMRRHLLAVDGEVDGMGFRLLAERREQLFDALDMAFSELARQFWERVLTEPDMAPDRERRLN